jgi:glucose-fructose oxidoreductase
MSKTYRLGAIGFGHMHINHLLDEFNQLPNIEWVACADTIPAVKPLSKKPSTRAANLKRAQEVIGIPKIYGDYRELLDKEKLDIVIFCPENAQHGEVAEAIANQGIHMVTEKPMAASLAEALRMVRAARANQVSLMVNWPSTWQTNVRKMKDLIDQGIVGEVWQVKWRNGASMGPLSYNKGEHVLTDAEKGSEWWHQAEPGGGALLDYCCYGACLSRWFIDEGAVAASGIKANLTSHYGNAEDNAVITVRFPKALAILEGTWTTWHVGIPNGPIVYGTQGALVPDGRTAVKVYTSRGYDPNQPDQVIEGDPLPTGRATLAEEFIHHLETGDPLHPTLDMDFNLEAMAILDAGIRSAASGQVETLNDATWCIG